MNCSVPPRQMMIVDHSHVVIACSSIFSRNTPRRSIVNLLFETAASHPLFCAIHTTFDLYTH